MSNLYGYDYLKIDGCTEYFIALAHMNSGPFPGWNDLCIAGFENGTDTLIHGTYGDKIEVRVAKMDQEGNFKIGIILTNSKEKSRHQVEVVGNINKRKRGSGYSNYLDTAVYVVMEDGNPKKITYGELCGGDVIRRAYCKGW